MRFSTVLLSVLAGASFALAHPLAEPSFTEQQLVLRNDGDVSVFFGRDITAEEIIARDSAVAVAAGGDSFEARSDVLSEDEVENLALRFIEDDILAERDLVEVEPRAVGAIVRGVAQGIVKIIQAIKGQIEKDKGRRGEFTSKFIGEALKKPGGFNWAICHTKHHYKFDGQRGRDWDHSHQEFNVAFGKTIGYEIYRFRSGTFTREGDGGYLNWAYGGNIKKKSGDGKVITFGRR